MRAAIAWHARLVLLAPRRVAEGLRRVASHPHMPKVPTLWQVELGVLRMWHRVLFRSETVGTCADSPVRATWRARLLRFRLLRFPFLLWEGAVTPWDLSGFLSGPQRIVTHLLGAHHDEQQFVYDLQMLSLHPGWIDELRRRVLEITTRDDRRSRWLRDLTVYEGYHENLLRGLDRFEAEGWKTEGDLANPDVSFLAYLDWCTRQPATPAATWRAWRRGAYHVGRGALADDTGAA